MKIIIIDYGSGNVASVYNALRNIDSNCLIEITNNESELKSSTHIILPGVGAFNDCMQGLRQQPNFLSELRKQIIKEKKPFLGICVGMQVLASIGYENGEHQGLNYINGRVKKLAEENLKIPHMGWNELMIKNNKHPLLKNIAQGDHFYFANSYHFICQNDNNVLAQVQYGSNKINAIIAKENIVGAQFHPEKSAEKGLEFLKNFINFCPV
ncbi:imidazole glycerol phosphate synthase subunit HisH [Alphaproteobacteria bacterium]|nr:imidazole glycerol phosphate synthase subunit HisH [Alphaproteobacteria bacterium]